MKKKLWLLFPVFLCFLSPSYAQIHENAWLLEENLQFFNKKNINKGNEIQKGFYFGQNVGVFMHKNVVFGAGVSYQKNIVRGETTSQIGSIVSNTNTYKIEERTWTPTVYVKGYHNISPKLYISGKLAYAYGVTKRNERYSNIGNISYDASDYLNNIGLTTELLFFVSKRIGLQVNFNGFNLNAYKIEWPNSTTKYTDFSFDMSPINWTFGAVILLN